VARGGRVRYPAGMTKRMHIVLGLALTLTVGACASERPVGERDQDLIPETAEAADLDRAGVPEEGQPSIAPRVPPAAMRPSEDLLAAPADVAGPPEDAQRTASGLAYKVLGSGSGGPHPTATDTVAVHYTGWTTDGKRFDSSVARGEPATFPLNGVIAGWTEGLQLMSVGDKFRFWIPADLAYGDPPRREGAPAGMLVFDVELLGIAGR
jgi:peptidylprolyl isomerase